MAGCRLNGCNGRIWCQLSKISWPWPYSRCLCSFVSLLKNLVNRVSHPVILTVSSVSHPGVRNRLFLTHAHTHTHHPHTPALTGALRPPAGIVQRGRRFPAALPRRQPCRGWHPGHICHGYDEESCVIIILVAPRIRPLYTFIAVHTPVYTR